jgi:hypothetical protein
MPVSDSIFGNTVDPLNIDGLQTEADSKIESLKADGCDSLTIYVTGLTVALVAVINACKKANIALTLMHFDRVGNCYYPQKVL